MPPREVLDRNDSGGADVCDDCGRTRFRPRIPSPSDPMSWVGERLKREGISRGTTRVRRRCPRVGHLISGPGQ